MENVRAQIGNQFPTVYITFISVLIGFAIEDLVSIIRDQPLYWPTTPERGLFWIVCSQRRVAQKAVDVDLA